MSTPYSEIPAQVVQDVEFRLGALLRVKALEAGWPVKVAQSMAVYGEGTDLTIEASDEAEDLEYGDGENVPSPVIRQFAHRSGAVEAELLRAAGDRLRGVL